MLSMLLNLLCCSASLRIPNSEKSFIVETHGSNEAIRAVLRQENPDESYPVSFFSIGLAKQERNCSSYE